MGSAGSGNKTKDGSVLSGKQASRPRCRPLRLLAYRAQHVATSIHGSTG